MNPEDIRKQLRNLNNIYKETDAIYNQLAKNHGLSSSAFWLMYIICEEEGKCTQKDLCDQLVFSKQTVHSALMSLENKEFVSLVSSQNDKRNKFIQLTELGTQFAQVHIVPIFQLEQEAFQQLRDEERELLISTNRKFQHNLKEAVEQYNLAKQ